ncbi:MAG: hypothetical protein LLG42_02365, partial [Chloroflexi bacterium]|nr:hypothetical protein [Chloroflexota bacterium]
TLKQSGVSSYFFSGAAGTTTNFDIGRTGQYVRIQLKGTNYLSLAEVQVWSDGTQVTPTPTPIPTSLVVTPNPSSLYKKQVNYPYYIPNFAHPDKGNNWFGVAGQIFNENGMPVNQIVVVVKGTLNGVAIEKSTQTGLNTDYGAGGYEIVLGNAPVATTGKLTITLYSLSGQAVSSPITFDTYADPLKNLVLINFQKK